MSVKGWRFLQLSGRPILISETQGFTFRGAILAIYVVREIESLADSLEAWIVHFLLRLRMRLDSLALMPGWIMPSQRVQRLVALGVSIC